MCSDKKTAAELALEAGQAYVLLQPQKKQVQTSSFSGPSKFQYKWSICFPFTGSFDQRHVDIIDHVDHRLHDRLHICPLCGIFYFPWHRHQIEGTNGF